MRGPEWILVSALLAGSIQADELKLPDNALRGRLLFEAKECYQCHGIERGVNSVGPNLGEGRFSGSFLDLGAALWNHLPGMSVTFEVNGLEWPELTEEEATDLVAFLYFIDYLGRPGVPAAGEALLETKGCVTCHRVEGRGGTVGPDLTDLQRFASPLYIAQAIWNHGPSMFEVMRQRGMAAPTFEEGDLADLSAYFRQRAKPGPQELLLLAPGNPNHGREVFDEKRCSYCHGGGRRGAPDLSRSDLHRSADGIASSMWNHAPAMNSTMEDLGVGWPQLTTPELADLVAYLYFLPFRDPAGNAERGGEVFAAKSCSTCHSREVGVDSGPSLAAKGAVTSGPALVADLWNHAPTIKRAVLGEGLPWPTLTGEELRDLLAFLRNLPEPP